MERERWEGDKVREGERERRDGERERCEGDKVRKGWRERGARETR